SGKWQQLALLPRALRSGMASAIASISPERWAQLLGFLPAQMRPVQAGDKLHKLASVLNADSGDDVYRRLVTHWEPDQLMSGVTEPKVIIWDRSIAQDFPNLLERMQFLDLVTYL